MRLLSWMVSFPEGSVFAKSGDGQSNVFHPIGGDLPIAKKGGGLFDPEEVHTNQREYDWLAKYGLIESEPSRRWYGGYRVTAEGFDTARQAPDAENRAAALKETMLDELTRELFTCKVARLYPLDERDIIAVRQRDGVLSKVNGYRLRLGLDPLPRPRRWDEPQEKARADG